MKNGFNPMRWDCAKRGCFNVKKRPKIEVFADCFPRKINFGDVDARVEINWHFLEIEWKPVVGPIAVGQRIAFERLTRVAPVTVFVVAGCPEHMDVESVAKFYGGKFYPWEDCTLGELKASIRRWVTWAESHQGRCTASGGPPLACPEQLACVGFHE